jgi:hypothetical protein
VPDSLPSRVSPARRAFLDNAASPLGVRVAAAPVCQGHHAPAEFLSSWLFDRPPICLLHGPRGGGKSFLTAFETHLASIVHPDHATCVLGGSLAQSKQIYQALKGFARLPGAAPFLKDIQAETATYSTGSQVRILAASSTSVRGPHVPSLKLDEVDEMDPDVRESAMGMCMAMGGVSASVMMTSTWHKVGGPMAELLGRGESGEFPVWKFCAFEVLERCPEERSGPHLEHCPECPLRPWCHDTPDGVPKAKRSDGHYAIDSLIQKVKATSRRVFESDYLCLGPKAEGIWFPSFTRETHVGDDAEYDPALPVYLAVDCGTSRFTAGVYLQVRELADGTSRVTVFADYLGVDVVSEANATELREVAARRCNGRLDRVRLDPASRQRTSVGPVVYGEYERVFGRLVAPWPLMGVRESIDLLDGFVRPASGGTSLRVHPRCEDTIRAMLAFRRAKVAGVYTDQPEREQHPHEDLVDALKGGIGDLFPEGRRPQPKLSRIHPRKVF